jgi:AcrR family transcriptional regulator
MVLTRDEIIKEEILAAAQRLFRQFGIRKSTMEDIAKHISKGKSTLYYYFSSKEEIFEAVLNKEMDEVCNQTSKSVELEITAEAKLKAYFITRLHTLRKMSNLFQLLKVEMLENPLGDNSLLAAYRQREVSMIGEILKIGIENGEFNERLLKQMDVMPFIIMSTLKGLEFDLFTDNGFHDIETRIDAIVDLLLKGLKNYHSIRA